MAKVTADCGHAFDVDTCESEVKMVCPEKDCRKVYETDFARENNDICPEDDTELVGERVYKCPECDVWYTDDKLEEVEDE